MKNVYSTGMFCNKQRNPENCIIIQNYRKTIDCPSLTKNANNYNHSVNSKFKLAHLNVRSLKNRDNLIQLRQLIDEQQHDILTISESWLNSTVKIQKLKSKVTNCCGWIAWVNVEVVSVSLLATH